MTAAVMAEGLSAGYSGRPVLRDVSFAADPGQTVCVLGPNGGGKTTLFRALMGELEPLAGRVDLSGRAAHVAQTERTRLDFPVSAVDVALMGGLATAGDLVFQVQDGEHRVLHPSPYGECAFRPPPWLSLALTR